MKVPCPNFTNRRGCPEKPITETAPFVFVILLERSALRICKLEHQEGLLHIAEGIVKVVQLIVIGIEGHGVELRQKR